MGRILTSVAVGWDETVIVTGVTGLFPEEQAVNINIPIRYFKELPGNFFITDVKILYTRHSARLVEALEGDVLRTKRPALQSTGLFVSQPYFSGGRTGGVA